MKVFGKWLVICKIDKHERMAASFARKKDAIEALDRCFKRNGENDWIDSLEQHFLIRFNDKEYKRA